MTPPTRWSAAEFERLRRHGDPEIDGPVASHARTHQGDARGLTMAVIKELEGAKQKARGNPAADTVSDVPTILDMLGLTSCLPDWGNDAALIRRGQQVFQDNGLYQSVALFCVCLPLSYAEPSTAKVLGEISDLATGNLTRRVAETGHMLIDVMALRGEDSLQP